MILPGSLPELYHERLGTTFIGVEHPISTLEATIHQFRGIKYASVPARFRQSRLFNSYSQITDATRLGSVMVACSPLARNCSPHTRRSVCPQEVCKSLEEDMFGLSPDESPTQTFKQNEFECLNLTITCPAGLNSQSRLPVMLWIHGYAIYPYITPPFSQSPSLPLSIVAERGARVLIGSLMVAPSCAKVSSSGNRS